MRNLDNLKALFEHHLASQSFPSEPANLYSPNTYFLQIGGKRLRPALLLLACEIYSGKAEQALNAAIAVEYFHNFSLIHDDVMDNAPFRRGFATIHEKYGLNTAILSGDVMLTYAYKHLSLVPYQYLQNVLEIFNQTAIHVCEGQQMDMDYEKRDSVSEDEYLKMIEYKTSVLLAGAMQIGSIIGGASRPEAEAIYKYALYLGIAFQIQDDILDCYGSPDMVGKTPGGDILQNKKTLLYINAVKSAQRAGDNSLSAWRDTSNNQNTEKLNAVLDIYEKYGVRAYAEKKRDELVDLSLDALKGLQIQEEAKNLLAELGRHLVYRNF